MKKTLKLMGLCALAVLVLAGCKKNEQNGNMTFKATISQLNNNAKTEIGSGNWLVWNDGDQIKVYTANKTEASAANFNIASGAGTTDATFSGDLAESDTYYAFYPTTGVELTTEGKFKLPVSGTQTFVDANFTTNTFPMCATATDGNFTFHSPYGILGIPMKGTATIGSIVLTDSLGMNLVGYYEMNDVDTTFIGSGAAITLNFGEGLTLSADTAKTAYFIVPAGVFTMGFKAEVKGTDGNRITMLETSKNNIIVKEYIRLMPEVTGVNGSTPAPTNPEGSINGLYSVSATQQVYFSKGNLQYIGSAGTPYWKFADNQWDYLGTTTGQNSTNPNVDRDLFGWGTWTGSNPNPANTSDNDSDYSWDNSDFVKTLQNGSGTWRTLNNDEWGYLFYFRASGATVTTTSGTTNDARYTQATINTDGTGVDGIILFPDGVTIASGEATSWGYINDPSEYGTKCTSAEWTALANKGCVFLPAAGRRYTNWGPNTNVQINGGYYWSSTADGSDYAYSMYFFSGYVNPQTDDDRRFGGHSVRLVQDYEGNGGGTGGGGNPGAGLNGMQTGSSHGW